MLVEEVEHDLGQRQVVGDLHALGGQVVHAVVDAAAVLTQLHDLADELLRREDAGPDVGLAHLGDARRVGHVGRVVDRDHGAVGERDLKLDARHGGHQLEVVLALEPLAHDVHVQEAEEAAAEAEAERV
jgi:hypothetical protein